MRTIYTIAATPPGGPSPDSRHPHTLTGRPTSLRARAISLRSSGRRRNYSASRRRTGRDPAQRRPRSRRACAGGRRCHTHASAPLLQYGGQLAGRLGPGGETLQNMPRLAAVGLRDLNPRQVIDDHAHRDDSVAELQNGLQDLWFGIGKVEREARPCPQASVLNEARIVQMVREAAAPKIVVADFCKERIAGETVQVSLRTWVGAHQGIRPARMSGQLLNRATVRWLSSIRGLHSNGDGCADAGGPANSTGLRFGERQLRFGREDCHCRNSPASLAAMSGLSGARSRVSAGSTDRSYSSVGPPGRGRTAFQRPCRSPRVWR